jgi:SAM-dependent methyltransferase
MLASLHSQRVFPRRRRVLAGLIGALLPPGSRVLDVGAGDGSVARLIQDQGDGVTIEGIDVLVRPGTAIPVLPFDGVRIPHADGAFDAVMLVDVLHHTRDPQVLLNEAARVARRFVIVKDHDRNGLLAGATLRFMDWVGNARFGVALPYNYWSREQWERGYAAAGLKVARRLTRLRLYPLWADWIFGRGLQSLVLLEK